MSIPMVKISLDQWRVFIAIVEHGSYGQAAEQLNKSQSTLSYAMQKLQEQLDIRLFEVKTKKPALTKEGQVLYRRAKLLLNEANAIESLSQHLRASVETEIRIAVEAICPYPPLLCALEELSHQYPFTRVELLESVLSGTADYIIGRQCELAIAGVVPQGFLGQTICQVEFIAMAAPNHPLNQLNRELTTNDLKQHRQIVVRDSGIHRRLSSGWLEAEQRWTVSHLSTSINIVAKGLGFAWLPTNKVQHLLEDNTLKPLPLQEGSTKKAPIYLIYTDRDSAGPVTESLAKLIIEKMG